MNALSREEKLQALLKKRRINYKSDLYLTCKELLGYRDMEWPTHGDMIEALESETKRKLLVMPRGTFKSSVGVVGYSIWRLMSDPNLRILIDGEVYTNSKNFIREAKALLTSDALVGLFGEWKTDHNWTESEFTIKQRTKSFKEASITAGGVDTVKVSQHYDVIIFDDVNSGNNSSTPEGCEKVLRHYKMSQALLEPNGVIVIIGTRYNVIDLPGFVLKQELNLNTLDDIRQYTERSKRGKTSQISQ